MPDLSGLQPNPGPTQQSERRKKLGSSLVALYDEALGHRGIHNNEFQEISRVILPTSRGFNTTETRGDNLMRRIYDFTGIWANEQLAAAIFGNFINPSERWFQFGLARETTRIEDEWSDEVQQVHYETYGNSASRFYPEISALLPEYCAFGNGTLLNQPRPDLDVGIKYRALPLRQTYYLIGDDGDVNGILIEKQITAMEVIRTYGRESLSDALQKQVDQSPFTEVRVVHGIYPRDTAKVMGTQQKGKLWASVHAVREDGWVLRESGFDSFPAAVAFWNRRPGEIYARGPGHTAKPECNMINEQRRTGLRGAQKLVDPPLFVPDEGYAKRIHTAASSQNFFRTGMGKEDRIFALETRGNQAVSNDQLLQSRQNILQAFFLDRFKLAKENVEMTRGEALIRRDEDLRQLSMMTGNMVEFLNKIHIETYNTLFSQGKIPEPPSSIRPEDQLRIDYTSAIAQAQKADEANALVRSLEVVAPFANFDPAVLDGYNADEVRNATKEWFNVSEKFFKPNEQIQAEREQRQEALLREQEQQEGMANAEIAKNQSAT